MPPRKKMTPTTFDEHLANVVDSKRSKTQMTVEEFADATGIGYQTMRRRLGGAPFTVNELERVSYVAGVQSVELVEEALSDYGGLPKLLEEYTKRTSEAEGNVTAADNVTYLGKITAPVDAAADDDPRTDPKG